jgi:hypothetical protein
MLMPLLMSAAAGLRISEAHDTTTRIDVWDEETLRLFDEAAEEESVDEEAGGGETVAGTWSWLASALVGTALASSSLKTTGIVRNGLFHVLSITTGWNTGSPGRPVGRTYTVNAPGNT